MNRQIIAGGLIGLGVVVAVLVGVTLGLGIPLGSLGGKSSDAVSQRGFKASSNQTTAQQPSGGTSTQQSSPNQNTQTPGDTSGTDNSAPVPALW